MARPTPDGVCKGGMYKWKSEGREVLTEEVTKGTLLQEVRDVFPLVCERATGMGGVEGGARGVDVCGRSEERGENNVRDEHVAVAGRVEGGCGLCADEQDGGTRDGRPPGEQGAWGCYGGQKKGSERECRTARAALASVGRFVRDRLRQTGRGERGTRRDRRLLPIFALIWPSITPVLIIIFLLGRSSSAPRHVLDPNVQPSDMHASTHRTDSATGVAPGRCGGREAAAMETIK
ncbi:hypothetical protein C8Q76DRAFT_319895 [Earliella scabrosa]|nr:hypothetical protein C8Q76DRAFT_319895 [Earliella scabrosa]